MNLGVTFQTTSRNFKRAPFPWARINDVHKRDMGTENALAIDPRQQSRSPFFLTSKQIMSTLT